MDFKHIILYLCVCTLVSCFPTLPLSDRPSELAWQAWLLVGSQNPSETERRITPKSIFVAPNLVANQNNDSQQPDCENGYRPDSKGKCIQFVKVDESAHLDFLLWRLNSMFGTKNSEQGDEDKSAGPLQLNIPLITEPGSIEKPEINEEIAIIVAPTNGDFEEIDLKIKRTEAETTTEVETTTLPTTTQAITTTTEQTTTETSTQQALFFLLPINDTTHVDNSTNSSDQTTDQIDNSTPNDTEPPAVKGKFDPEDDDAPAFVRFPNLDTTTASSQPTTNEESTIFDTFNTNNHRLSNSEIIFPENPNSFRTPVEFHKITNEDAFLGLNAEEEDRFQRPPPDSSEINNPPPSSIVDSAERHKLSNTQIKDLFRRYIQKNPDVVSLTSTDNYGSRRRPVSESTYLDTSLQPQQYHYPTYSHRNRDRNSQFWRPNFEDSLQKPLVLRFGRQQADKAYLRFNPDRLGEELRYFEKQEEYPNPGFARVRRRGHLR